MGWGIQSVRLKKEKKQKNNNKSKNLKWSQAKVDKFLGLIISQTWGAGNHWRQHHFWSRQRWGVVWMGKQENVGFKEIIFFFFYSAEGFVVVVEFSISLWVPVLFNCSVEFVNIARCSGMHCSCTPMIASLSLIGKTY